ncbi:class I SAM-dependent methyltransferase [Lysinibacillus sp. BF-4]|uniref:class I SAM-dependent methyltransferase n=1 Tax=Lysinibacillus sp. BF-4 TaxID=1473546 RepID=UPI000A6AEC35|nr:class I SAM-dependent methyltransferase [Lysinibacillus sp. BF-4]
MTQITVHRILPMAKRFLAKVVASGDAVIDATAGNGNETRYLAELVGDAGCVYAFDVQQEALAATAQKLGPLQSRVKLIHDGHENVLQYVKHPIAAATFNLGYLPYTDTGITTKAQTTIQAINAILQSLKCGGIITVSVYEGHDGGAESSALLAALSQLEQSVVHVARYELINQRNNAPYLLLLEKLK